MFKFFSKEARQERKLRKLDRLMSEMASTDTYIEYLHWREENNR